MGVSLRYRASSGTPVKRLVAEAFPLVIEAARRHLGQIHFDEQILGGLQLSRNRIVEMKTGEGKTLTATLPAFLFGLRGLGVHIVTVNDYLAARDRDTMGPIYEMLGLSTGVVQSQDSPQQRAQAYRQDITYITAKEIGFDFLRDRIAQGRARSAQVSSSADSVQRPFYFALVDEADSILIDEARTPLIIGMSDPWGEALQRECYKWSAEHAADFVEDEHYEYEHDKRQVKLTSAGWRFLRDLPQNAATRSIGIRSLKDYMETAIKARRDFHLDKHYASVDQKIVIIDEFTGRPAEGRQWQKGLHQAVEAKEGVTVTPATRQAGTITVQALFKLYPFFSGMTGTAWTSRHEFRRVYRRRVSVIPTHKPVSRTALATQIFATVDDKFAAVVREIEQMTSQQRPVLIGTRSVDKSEKLSSLLTERRISHQVLNARYLANEAERVAEAGRASMVTVATNMAGRGTDIILGGASEGMAWKKLKHKYTDRHEVPHDEWHQTLAEIENDPIWNAEGKRIRELGGLHVILTEIHEAQRIDRQLIGRGARQGDPGSYRIFVSLQDEILLLGLGPKKFRRLQERFQGGGKVPASYWRLFQKAQRRLERRYLVDRMILMEQDKQRRRVYFDTGQDPYLDIAD